MIVLVVTDGMDPGGTERQIVELLKGLKRSGKWRTALAVLSPGGTLESEAAEWAGWVLPVHRKFRLDPRPLWALPGLARGLGARVVHTFGWMSSLAGRRLQRKAGLAWVDGGVRYAPPKLRLREWVGRWAMRGADAIVSNSRAGLRAWGLEGHPRARVIPNGIDPGRFPTGGERSGPPTACMVANFTPSKDHETAVRAWALVRRELPDARLRLVGLDRGTRARVEGLVHDLGLDDAIEWVAQTNHPESIIAACDIGVLASDVRVHGEGISNALLECLACGKPVVATACGGNDEAVTEGETGHLVAPRTPEALAARVLDLLRDPARARRMGEAGRRDVSARFSLERMVAEHERVYADVMSGASRV